MTKEQLRVPTWAIPILLSVLVSAVFAYATLGGKEDASAHAADVSDLRREHTADVVRLQAADDSLRFDARLRDIRDSARHADVMRGQAEQTRILLDLQRKVNR